jgi:uncharacterized protein YaiI (UPF0178 family)
MLRDGIPYVQILKWLNAQIKPPYKAISLSNLSDWRKSGYQAWREERKKYDHLRDLSEKSYVIANATGGNPAVVAARMLATRVLELANLMTEDGTVDEELLVQITRATSLLVTAENESSKLDLQNRRLALKEEGLRFSKEMFRQKLAEKFLKWVQNQDIVAIAKSESSHEEKIAAILRHMDLEEAEDLEGACPHAPHPR